MSPWYDLRGWLGVKQQLSIYLSLAVVLPLLGGALLTSRRFRVEGRRLNPSGGLPPPPPAVPVLRAIQMSVPVHTNYTIKTYREAGIIKIKKLNWNSLTIVAVSKYVIRSLSVTNSVSEEMFIDSNKDYPKRSQNIPSIHPIRNYTYDLISDCNNNIDLY